MSSSDEVACGEKTSWPELVGKSIEEAKKTILKDRPDVKTVEVFPVGAKVTEDFRLDRVRIFVDTVAEIPRIG
jgi:predicted MarR family transcription regulator